MATEIGPLSVRRCAWIDAPPERVWEEFGSLERMQTWYGTGHTLVSYAPEVGAIVETDAGGEEYRFVGPVLVYDPARELTFEQDWVDHGWTAPTRITIRLTPLDGGTLVELFHHGFEAFGADAGDVHRGFESGWDSHHLDALNEIVNRQ